MSNIRIPVAVCAAIAEVLTGSHQALEAQFKAAGIPGPAPDLPHSTKWKTWISQAGNDPEIDSLKIIGNLLEEFMDLPPIPAPSSSLFGIVSDPVEEYKLRKDRLVTILEQHGFRYFRGGQVLQIDAIDPDYSSATVNQSNALDKQTPSSIDELLTVIIKGLPRAIQPLIHRRKGLTNLVFDSEYDIQDMLHSLLRPWVADIRPEEFTPSHAGANTRMDFLLPKYELVIETKRVRTKSHASKIGDELIIDIEHYRKHPKAKNLWCVIYDPNLFITNPDGLKNDLEGNRASNDGEILVKVFVVGANA